MHECECANINNRRVACNLRLLKSVQLLNYVSMSQKSARGKRAQKSFSTF